MEYLDSICHVIADNKEIIFSLIGLIGTVFTICGFFIKHIYKLGYIEKRSLPLRVDENVENDLQILYKGHKISLLRGVIFRIFNYGNKALRKEDLYSNKLSIEVTGGKILDIKIKAKEQDGDAKLVKVNDSKFNIEFDYMNPLQIYELSILYDGDDAVIDCHAAGMSEMQQFFTEYNIKDMLRTFLGILLFSFISTIVYLSNFHKFFDCILFVMLILSIILLTISLIDQVIGWIKSPNSIVFKYDFSMQEVIKDNKNDNLAS